jgi:hypothetical protein
MMVAYSEATATTAGTTACTPVNIAMRKLCFSSTGWVIWNPLERERLCLYVFGRNSMARHDRCIIGQVH